MAHERHGEIFTLEKSGRVALRARKTNIGYSLYLDYTFRGKREKVNLKMYMDTINTRRLNRMDSETLKIAKEILYERAFEISTGKYSNTADTNFCAYFFGFWQKFIEMERKDKNICKAAYDNFVSFSGGEVKFSELTNKLLLDYQNYLLAKFKKTTASRYYAYFIICLNNAEKTKATAYNLDRRNVKSLTPEASTRVFLSEEEVEKLKATDCENRQAKRIFLFACNCGLRSGDLKVITWDNIEFDGSDAYIYLKQKKKGKVNRIRLSDLALCLLGKKVKGVIFDFNSVEINEAVSEWAAAAGITKRVTLHVARHTFATFLLNKGVAIKVVSELLGHSDIKTTEIYAKLIDKTKGDALDAFNS